MPGSHDANAVHFNFDDKGNYTYQYASLHEAGTYKIENDMLFTKLPNENEMMVKIVKLSADSLVFDMSRNGTDETLFLLKEK
ncbi:MAG: lipocalin family protein [Niastella sp.]|nr:lipocalin family protein [Niastella sp.]